jgi:hypothetical protein
MRFKRNFVKGYNDKKREGRGFFPALTNGSGGNTINVKK